MPVVLPARGMWITAVGVTGYPLPLRHKPAIPGWPSANLRSGVPEWLIGAAGLARSSASDAPDAVVVLAHWGPNMR
jgi:hypothetical protein